MEKRRAGENTTFETRAEAHESIDKNTRYKQILECFEREKQYAAMVPDYEMGLTAKRIAVIMYKKGYIPTAERNFTAPRLTELCQMGIVEPVGKKMCGYTGKKVTAYGLVNKEGLK